MSDDSFRALDALVQEEVQAVSALTQENARLRALLSERDAAPSSTFDPAALFAELQATKVAQAELAAELQALRESRPPVAVVEDQASEVALLRGSLVDLATQLEAERTRVSALEAERREAEEKVTTLRSKVEESRRAIMRLQTEASNNKPRGSIDMQYSFPPRRASLLANESTVPRRRSSLGLAAIAASPEYPASPSEEHEPEPQCFGLGFGLSSPASAPIALSSSPTKSTSTATPLARLAHRRGSASIAVVPEDEDDAQRINRLRELRLGVHSTKVASRRNSAVSGLPDFVQPGDFEWDLERRFARRLSTSSSRRTRSGEDSDADAPLSANLRLCGRKDSVAMFESWSRRSSLTDSVSDFAGASQPSGEMLSDLRLQLDGLRIQLAEAEEGRRASETCLQALREYIVKSNSNAEQPMSLPPLPTDPTLDDVAACTHAPRSGSSRWSIPRLSLTSRRDSAGLTAESTRRGSSASTASATTYHESRTTPSLASFGSFSFSALVSRSSSIVDGDASPKMSRPPRFNDDNLFPVEPTPLLRSLSASSVARSTGHSPSASIDDSVSIAPSLISDLSSANSAASSRSPSPSPFDDEDEVLSPRVVIDFAAEDDAAHPFALSDEFGVEDKLVSAARMPVVKGSLVTLASAARAVSA
ncbi:hypothetical protein Rhopal_003129-T1 [Rhodotorula paludigena]|uniref:Proteophosphoglycan ppg4 n=1 Tax=Rhodotorula paludigena TaxID=86838 RepID=A0AAV5GJU8_9BASI|nr:hypothetical protein Rhopal_003129-T1 [Rhodotorula paludigena]